jgi:hypothetical protein
VLARSFEELRDAVRTAIDAHDDPAAALIAAGRAYVGFAWDHPARSDYLRLGPLDRSALVETLIRRIARLPATLVRFIVL